ncbi:MAG TPA: SBBP repeat-containing protein [Pyrinomonadaceae bacterium]|nr:SBBP repeat-containing protein [Pyrinomonadaceae bacterium]
MIFLPPPSLHFRRVVLVGVVCLLATLSAVVFVAADNDDNLPTAVSSSSDTTALAPGKTRIAEQFGALPLSFEINKGQVDQPVKFLSHGPGYDLFLTATEAVLRLRKPRPLQVEKLQDQALGKTGAGSDVREGTVVRLKMLGANATPQVEGQEELPGKVNYFIGNDQSKWRRNIPTYRRVYLKDVYPGIDMVYYGKQRQLEYDLVVAPGANPKLIRFTVEGADQIRIDKTGRLLLGLKHGEVSLNKPVIYQLDENGNRREVKGAYLLKGNEVRFKVERFDSSKPLIIDPVLIYSTLLGSLGSDNSFGIAVDSQGSAYVTGTTDNTTFPTTSGAFKSTTGFFGGAFVSKLDPTGSTLVYSTYLGGGFSTSGLGIAVDSAGNAHVTGTTNSTDFPLVSALKTSSNFFKTTDAAANWNNLNSGLVSSVHLLAVAPSAPNTIYAETSDGIYLSTDAGATWSKTPATGFASFGFTNALAVDPTNSSVVYAGHFTGLLKSTDSGASWTRISTPPLNSPSVFSVVFDPATPSTMYVGASTGVFKTTDSGATWIPQNNFGLPTVPNVLALAIDPATPLTVYAGTFGNGLFKSTNGGAVWTAMNSGMGGGNPTTVNSIVIDPGNPATIYTGHGTGNSSGGINKSVNGGASWTFLTGVPDSVVISMVATSSAVYVGVPGGFFKTTNGGSSWTSAVSGLGSTFVDSLAVHPTDSSILYAGTSGAGLPDAFVTKLNSSGSGLLFSTLLGGHGEENGNAIAVDGSGNISIAGRTSSTNFPVVNAFKSTVTFNGNCATGFVTKLNPAVPSYTFSTYLGDGQCETVNSIATDGSGNVYVTGRAGNGFPTVNAFQPTQLGGDAFVTKFMADGSVVYSTYLGGTESDTGFGIAADSSGNAYITGSTNSSNFPLMNPIQATIGPPQSGFQLDAFVTKLNSDGSALIYSTYLGGTGFDGGLAIAVDSANNAYVTGRSESVDFPLVAGALRTRSPMHKSVDGAANWSNDNYGFTGASAAFAGSVVTDLAIHPTQPSTLYAGTGNGVFKTTNGGRTWSAINNGLLNRNVVALVMDPSTPSTLYAATAGSVIGNTGVYKTTDSGNSWNLRSNGITSPDLVSLAIDPVTPNTLYAGFSVGGPGSHLYKTTDGADNWNLVGTPPPSVPASIAIDPLNHTTLYVADGGVHKSIDAGATWQSLGLSGANARSVAVSPLTAGLVYAGTREGLFKSVDGGSNWSLIPSVSGKVVFDPVSSSTAYLLSAEFMPNPSFIQRPQGVFKTTDNGQTWIRMNKGIESSVPTALVIHPVRPSTLYVAVKPPGGFDVFVTKINPAGSSLIYSTFIGGPLSDSLAIASAQASGIALDSSGNAYITGVTSSLGYPVTPGSYQPFIRGGNDAFISKLGTSYIISGQVLDNGLTPLSGVEVVLNDGTSLTNVLTDSDGSYQFSQLREGGNYTVSASRPHFTMTPASQTFNNLNSDQVLNFNALTSDSPFYTISGQITENGVALAGVKVALSGSQSGLRTTDSNGNYSFELIVAGNYTVTPSMIGFNFGPTSQTFNSLSGPQIANFAATRQSFVVTNDNNHGTGSLREAIINANATVGPDTIVFNIPGPGVKVISLLTALPEITEQVVIDASTQPGYAGTPLIELDGSGAGNFANGLVIKGGGSTVRGLAIGNFQGTAGIWLNGCNNNIVQANYLGIAADGTTERENRRGIVLNNSSNNVIGGASAATRNVISGNGGGIDIVGSANLVQGNFIGTNATGTAAVPNGAGVSISNLSPVVSTDNVIGGTAAGAGNLISGNQTGISTNGTGTTIQGNLIGTNVSGTSKIPNTNGIVAIGLNILVGGPAPGARNVISGNQGDGVYLRGAGNKLQGNYIGTDITGTLALGNNGNGVIAGENALIGGTMPEERNIISANGNFGNVALGYNSSGSSATVQGNYIGTDVTGMRSLGTTVVGINIISSGNLIGGVVAGARNVISGNFIGIQIETFSGPGVGNLIQGNFIGVNAPGTGPLGNFQQGIAISAASNNTIGGTQNEAGNLIAFNGGHAISAFLGTGNTIRRNSIFSNNGLGIDLGMDGVTANDVNDTDTGPNQRQNFPVITTVLSSANSTTIQGTLNSIPNTTFQIDFYSNASVNPSGNGDGAQFVGTAPVNTDGNGNATIDATFPVGLSPGRVITATATDPNGNTSEFSAADASSATGRVQFTNGVLKVIEDIGMITLTVQRTGGTAGNLTVDYSTADGTAIAGQDYTATSGTLNFSAGETSKTIQIPILDNAPVEPDEVFTVSLSNTPTLESLGAPLTMTVTVQDHSTIPTMSILDLFVVEGNPGTTTDVSFRVVISAATGRAVGGNFATSNISAFGGSSCNDQGVDYEAKAGTFSIENGSTQTEIVVRVCGDTSAEANETFRVILSNVSGATVLPSAQGLGTIVNDDVLGLILEESGPSPNQAAALDQLLGLRDPFSIVTIPEWFVMGPDRNTRVVLFARNLQLNPGEAASAVIVRLQSSTFQLFDLPAQDVRPIPGTEFTQVIIRLPDNVAPGMCTLTIRAHTRISNSGTFRIAP